MVNFKKHSCLCLFLCFFILIGCNFAFGSIKTKMIKINILKVFDGDTVRAQTESGEIFNIRLKGIDCYETSKINRAYKQAYQNSITIDEVINNGIKSKQKLQSFLKVNESNLFYYQSFGKDKYNRELGVLYCNDFNINKFMIEQGGCFKYIYRGK